MPPGKWPKDTHPQAIRRANEVAPMSRADAIDTLRASHAELHAHLRHVHLNQRLLGARFNTIAQQIAADPVASAIKTIADELDISDIKQTLRMFVYLFNVADELQALLESEPVPDRKRKLLDDFCAGVSSRFSGRQIIDPSVLVYYSRNPAELTVLLKGGLAPIHAIWGTLNAQSRRKLVRDVLDSNKGHTKTARAVAEWRPPSQVSLNSLVGAWLESFSNGSVFTGMWDGNTTVIRTQITTGYAGAPQGGRYYMWFTLFYQIGNALGIAGDPVALRGAVQGGVEELVAAFDGVLGAEEVRGVVAAFDAVWDAGMMGI
jgi:hypothetical protein